MWTAVALVLGVLIGYSLVGVIRGRSNCWLVAMSAWIRSKGRVSIGVRRSIGKSGRVPHFSVVSEWGEFVGFEDDARDGTTLYLLEYAPPEGSRKEGIMDAGAFPLMFDGLYYVRRYRLEADGVGATFEDATTDMVARGEHQPDAPCIRPETCPHWVNGCTRQI